ncbi:MAG: DUF262 domain-containing protein [Ktedonobacteraceae bacterium]
MKIACVDKEMKVILETGYYRIPRFQRPYSWERENIEDFWNDTIINNDTDYFIGSMVVFREKSGIFCVVDGQQRLTTVTMILAALRNTFQQERLHDLARGIHRLIERADIDNKDLYVLQTETSYPYLQEYIQKFGPPDIQPEIHEEEEGLRKSFGLITSFVLQLIAPIKANKALLAEERKEQIRAILAEARDKILNLKLVFVEVDNEDDAYTIFETLNTRGKDLSASDLVKNYVLRLIRPKNANVDLAKDKWTIIKDTIEGSPSGVDINTFLHHFWLSRYDYVSERDLYKDIKERISEENARAFLEELFSDCKIYRQMNEPTFRKWSNEEDTIRKSLEAFNTFRVRQPAPIILAIIREYDKGGLKKRHVEDILSAIESFHFIFTAVTSQHSSASIAQMYASSARRLLAAKGQEEKLAILRDLKTKLKEKLPDFQEFEASFVEIRYSDAHTKNKRLVRYILRRFDSFFNTSGVALNYELMTIEHLAPQNPRAGNSVKLPHVSLLGNLILVDNSLNRSLGNNDFAQKQRDLLKSRVWMDETIKQAKKWTEADIEARTKQLADLAYNKVWAIKV